MTDSPMLRYNDQITAPMVRVIDDQGNQHGIMPAADALERARQAGLDLVEVAPRANPPVCRLMDFPRWKAMYRAR